MMIKLTYFFALSWLCSTLVACDRSAQASDEAAAVPPSKPITWHDPRLVATGPAEVGPWRMNESEFHYVDDATASLRGDGAMVFAWVDNERQDVFLQRFDNEGDPQLKAPVNVSRSPSVFSWLPRVLLTADGQVYALWQEIIFSGGSHGGEIFFARSGDGGQNFDQPLNLSSTVAGAGKGRLTEERWDNGSLAFALGGEGEIFVAWTEYEGALRFRRSVDGGRSFSEPTRVSGSERQPARAPALAVGPGGTLYLAWTVGENAAADIHVARSEDGGESFGPARIVNSSNGHSDAPALAADAEGNVHVVYAESPAGQSHRAEVRYTRLDQSAEAQTDPRTLSHNDSGAKASAPSIGVDSKGRVYIVWEHHPAADKRARGLGFVLSSDAGQTFTQPEVIPGSKGSAGAVNGSLQGQLGRKLTVGGKGEVVVTNSHFIYGDRSHVLFIRGHARSE